MKHILAILLLSLSNGEHHAQNAEQFMVQAQQALNYYDYSGAVKYMNKAVKLEPQNEQHRLQRGNLHLVMERFKKAKKDFDVVIEVDSTNAHGWIGLADYFRGINELDTALKCAEWAQILAQDDLVLSRARIALADVYLTSDNDSIATVHYMTSLEVDSNNVAALKKVAGLLSARERYDEANNYLMKAYMLDRYDLETLVNLAYTFNQVEFFHEAVEYSNLALQLDPQHPLILSNRAYAYLQIDMVNNALQDIKRSINNDGTNPMAHRYAGEIYIELKDKDKACKAFKKAEKFGYSALYDDGLVEDQLVEHCGVKREESATPVLGSEEQASE